jgi:uncharacterized protein with PIN domain
MGIVAELELCPECAVDIETGRTSMLDVTVTDRNDFGRITCDSCGGYWLGEYYDAVEYGR